MRRRPDATTRTVTEDSPDPICPPPIWGEGGAVHAAPPGWGPAPRAPPRQHTALPAPPGRGPPTEHRRASPCRSTPCSGSIDPGFGGRRSPVWEPSKAQFRDVSAAIWEVNRPVGRVKVPAVSGFPTGGLTAGKGHFVVGTLGDESSPPPLSPGPRPPLTSVSPRVTRAWYGSLLRRHPPTSMYQRLRLPYAVRCRASASASLAAETVVVGV